MNTLLLLISGHYLGDYGLQTDYMAKFKGQDIHVMLAHCAIHAGIVLLVTKRIDFAIAEFVVHWGLDSLKCKGKISLHFDQVSHILFKVGLWGLS